MNFKRETYYSDKHNKKEWLCFYVTLWADQKKLLSIVIVKYKKPQYFKNVKKSSHSYGDNNKVCMALKLFSDFLEEMDMKKKKSFAIYGPTNPSDLLLLIHTWLLFFPANSTNRLQPLDLRIIRSVNMPYRKDLVQRTFITLEQKKKFKKTFILDVHMLVSSWNILTTTTISNYF